MAKREPRDGEAGTQQRELWFAASLEGPQPGVERILERLNDAQREAVTHDQGPLLIVAGAGTGKTTVITRRIAYLIASKRCRPEEVLALTFTDKAAAEMEERVDTLVPYGYADVWISTFHAFGDRLLKENALEIGLTPDFRILMRAEQVIFFRDRLFEFPLEHYRPLGDPTRHVEAIISLISRAKDEDVSPEEYLGYAEGVRSEAAAQPDLDPEWDAVRDRAAQQWELARSYTRYQELMARQGCVDFGDQIVFALKLFRSRPYVLANYQRRFKYILVDEFQDTNYAQFELVKLLVSKHRNVTVVGDDDQAIFRFRGASMSNILDFTKTYPDARKVVLTENFRSPQGFLDAAYRLIRHNNPDRLEVAQQIDKRLVSRSDPGERGPVSSQDGQEPRHLHYDTVTSEADGVAAIIRDRVEARVNAYSDFAILVRANNDADPFLRALNLRGIPWTFSGNAGLYGRPEIRLLVAFLRSVAHPDDSISVHYLASSDLYRVPIVDLTRSATIAERRNRWLFDVLRSLDEVPEVAEGITPEGRSTITRFLKDLERYMELAREMPTGELLYQFLADSGWLERMSRAVGARDETEVQNISRFFRRIQDASKVLRYDNVREFVNHLDALMDAGEDPPVVEADLDTPAVHVLTLHKAKGLEFPVVFLVSLVQNKFPSTRRSEPIALPDPLIKDTLPTGDFHLQEERRLFYVGMTRAKQALYLTSARDYGGTRERKVSQFVLEALDLPKDAAKPFKAKPIEEIHRHASPPGTRESEVAPIPPEEAIQISHRQVDDYQTCPLKYKYIHVLNVPIMRHHTVVYGNTLHKVVEYYLRRRAAGLYTPLEDMLAIFDREWRNEGFLTWEHEEARKQAGRAALTRFWHEEEASGVKPAHVEKEFGFNLGADRVRGRFDRVDETDAGPVIIDYKSSEIRIPRDAVKRARESLQLKIYALAYQEMTETLPAHVELRFLESGLVGHHRMTEVDVREAADKIKEAAAGIRARQFEATPGYQVCRYCAYNQVCPYTATRE
ncbi:MAG: ATP-dependent helicase [Candidatus Methylomirabilia bacterium]